MDSSGFILLSPFAKIQTVLYLLGKYSGEVRAGNYWQIHLYDDMSGNIGYEYYGWQKEYNFDSEKELEETLLLIYEKYKENEE